MARNSDREDHWDTANWLDVRIALQRLCHWAMELEHQRISTGNKPPPSRNDPLAVFRLRPNSGPPPAPSTFDDDVEFFARLVRDVEEYAAKRPIAKRQRVALRPSMRPELLLRAFGAALTCLRRCNEGPVEVTEFWDQLGGAGVYCTAAELREALADTFGSEAYDATLSAPPPPPFRELREGTLTKRLLSDGSSRHESKTGAKYRAAQIVGFLLEEEPNTIMKLYGAAVEKTASDAAEWAPFGASTWTPEWIVTSLVPDWRERSDSALEYARSLDRGVPPFRRTADEYVRHPLPAPPPKFERFQCVVRRLAPNALPIATNVMCIASHDEYRRVFKVGRSTDDGDVLYVPLHSRKQQQALEFADFVTLAVESGCLMSGPFGAEAAVPNLKPVATGTLDYYDFACAAEIGYFNSTRVHGRSEIGDVLVRSECTGALSEAWQTLTSEREEAAAARATAVLPRLPQQLLEIARDVSDALRKTAHSLPAITTRTFPFGASFDSCWILGAILLECGACNANEVFVCRGERDTAGGLQIHWWLEVRGSIIDLAGDEFRDGVTEILPRTSEWHSTFFVMYRKVFCEAFPPDIDRGSDLDETFGVISQCLRDRFV